MNKNPTVFELLFTLDHEEFLRFRDFLRSPYFNNKKLPVLLFDHIHAMYQSWERDSPLPKFIKAEAHRFLYQDKPFKPQRIRRVLMELMTLLVEFLTISTSTLFHKDFEREYAVRKHLLDRGKFDLYVRRVGNSILEDRGLAQIHYGPSAFSLFLFERQYNEYLIHTGALHDTIELELRYLDEFALGTRLELWTAMRNRERIFDQEHTLFHENEIRQMLISHKGCGGFTGLWKYVFDLFDSKNPQAAFENLQSKVHESYHLITLPNLRQIHGYMYNHLLSLDLPKPVRYNKLWTLLSSMLSQGTLHAGGKINEPFFRVTVISSVLANEPLWAKSFLNQYGQDLKSEEKESQLLFFECYIEFHLGNHHQIFKKSATLRFSDRRYEIYLRVLLLKTAYEMEDSEEFFRIIDAFRKFLKRDQRPSPGFVNRFLKFVNIMTLLARIRFENRGNISTALNMLQEPGYAEYIWINQKAQELSE